MTAIKPHPIVLVMLSRKSGGLEQSVLDYAEALCGRGYDVSVFLHPQSPLHTQISSTGATTHSLRQWGEWDPFARFRLRRALIATAPQAVITIGKRASVLTASARRGLRIKHMVRTPNYNVAYTALADVVLATTIDLRRAVLTLGVAPDRVTVVPNMVRLPKYPAAVAQDARFSATPLNKRDNTHETHTPCFAETGIASTPYTDVEHPSDGDITPPLIGTLGRFVEKKGFAVLLEALAHLKRDGIAYRAMIGGDGPLSPKLHHYAASLGLDDVISFPGWIEDKTAFFAPLDIFVLPSLSEPFGIVVLEAMAQRKAIIASHIEGPADILTDSQTGLMVPPGDAHALAHALRRLIQYPSQRTRLAATAYRTVAASYALPVVAEHLDAVLHAALRGQPLPALPSGAAAADPAALPSPRHDG